MRLCTVLLAGVLVALPLSYEWVVAVLGPLAFDTLWQSVEALARAQALGIALCVLVVIPAVMICRWLWSRLT